MKRREVTKYVFLFLYSLRLQGVYSFTKCTKELFKVYGAWYLSCIGLMLYLVISYITAAASDKAYQLLARGRLFCRGTPASSTTKTGLKYC